MLDHANKPALGLVTLIAGVALFSTVEVLSKLIGTRVSPWLLVFLRFFITGLVLLALAGRDLPRRLAALNRRDYGLFAFNGFVSIALAISLFHLALLVFEKAASCAVVFSANPIFVMLLARFINREPLTWPKAAAVLSGAVGVAFFAWESGAFTLQSLRAGLIAVSALLFSAGICISRRVIHSLRRVHSHGVHDVVWQPDGAALGGVEFVAYRAGGIAFRPGRWCWRWYCPAPRWPMAQVAGGLHHCTAFQASMPFFLKPVLASLLAMVWLGEELNLFMVLGSLCILSGLVITVVFSAGAPALDPCVRKVLAKTRAKFGLQ